MRRRELEAALRAAGRLAGESEFFLIGSQALHAYCEKPPVEVLLSQECDLYPKNRPELVAVLDTELGRRSRFARRHGFYVDVTSPAIATLPVRWESRLKPFRAGSVTALCLEAHDLLVSKLAAGRLKDLEFTGALLRSQLANVKVLRRRIGLLSSERDRVRLRSRLQSVLHELEQ